MTKPRYAIGIDLGTTNCALAYCDLKADSASSEVFSLPQYLSAESVQKKKNLPSFIYFLGKAEQKAWGNTLSEGQKRIVGIFAKEQAVSNAARVAHSAKSWLCHREVDAYAKILPWGSDVLSDKEKCSAVEASALYLSYLKEAWDEAFKPKGEEHLFHRQRVVITVPASFDIVAQELTLEAAKMAGFPKSVLLLEEPQAAFYRWLENTQEDSNALKTIENLLVCDIGGGTSDFSLFKIENEGTSIQRVAVSDHILLGGDNIDLALAHHLEPQLSNNGSISAAQWTQLVAQCRALKERALSDSALLHKNETLHIALAGQGASLFMGSKSAQMQAKELASLIEEGFFPKCSAEEKPKVSNEGLREFGLPYAKDSAITRHLAAFLGGNQVDAVLFNGGCLIPAFLQERLCSILSEWQGKDVAQLSNNELDLAVARGAAFYGKQKTTENVHIEAKIPYAFYIEVESKEASERSLVCLLPEGADTGTWYDLNSLSLKARINQPVEFRVFYSHRRKQDRLGSVSPWDEAAFLSLPPLETMIQLRPGSKLPANQLLDVRFKTKVTALGLLEIYATSADPDIAEGQEWKLTFNLRQEARQGKGKQVTPKKWQEHMGYAQELIQDIFTQKSQAMSIKPNQMVGALEEAWGIPRNDWPLELLRLLWPILYQVITKRNQSPQHEWAWLYIAGFCLRPGYGSSWDSFYLEELWRLHELGLSYPKDSNVFIQQAILWRRVAGGLNMEQQEKLLKKFITHIKGRQPIDEVIRMCASMERVGVDYKRQIFNLCLERARFSLKLKNNPYLWALGRLLSRMPLYAGPEYVMPESYVREAFEALKSASWDKQVQGLFMRAGRLSGERSTDISEALRKSIIQKLEKSKAESAWIEPLKEYKPIEQAESSQLFGDSLPLGLIMQ